MPRPRRAPAIYVGDIGVSVPVFMSTVFILTVSFTIVGYIMHKRQENRMHQEVRGIMAQYMTIDANRQQGDTSMGLPEDGYEDDEDEHRPGEFTIT